MSKYPGRCGCRRQMRALLPRKRGRCRAPRGGGGWCWGSGVPPPSAGCAACHLLRRRGRRKGAVFIFGSSCTHSRTGFRHPGISVRLKEPGAAGAVALRLELKRLRNGALPPAAPDRGFGGTPSWGPMVPGLRYRRHANGSSVLFTREVHPGRPDSRAAGRGGFPTCFRRLTLA